MSGRTVAFRGTSGAGTRTLTGNLLYKCNGVDLETLERLERQGQTQYDKIVAVLHELQKPIAFEAPKGRIEIVYNDVQKVDCAIVVGSINSDPQEVVDQVLDGHSALVVINKMDLVNWNQADLTALVEQINSRLQSRGKRQASTYYVPTDALRGDNLIEISSRSPCLVGRTSSEGLESQPLSLIECLEKTFAGV